MPTANVCLFNTMERSHKKIQALSPTKEEGKKVNKADDSDDKVVYNVLS